MKEACMEAALENTPAAVELVVFKRRLAGRSILGRVIEAPKPYTRRALHIFLHECAHIALGHFDGNYREDYVAEYEAERWASQRMRLAGIPVPRKALRSGKRYVAAKILLRGNPETHIDPIDRKVLRWARPGASPEEWRKIFSGDPQDGRIGAGPAIIEIETKFE